MSTLCSRYDADDIIMPSSPFEWEEEGVELRGEQGLLLAGKRSRMCEIDE